MKNDEKSAVSDTVRAVVRPPIACDVCGLLVHPDEVWNVVAVGDDETQWTKLCPHCYDDFENDELYPERSESGAPAARR